MHVRAMVWATILAELVGVLLLGLLLLLMRLAPGDWTEGVAWTGLPVLATVRPPLEYFGRRPPHRARGAAAGLLTFVVLGGALLLVTGQWVPADEGLDGVLAMMLAAPVATGVFAAVSGPAAAR
ncbi:hypothetical protein [Kitasatospora sp. NPDC057500]|uniref:hypothetical protein n=1 Tax=Kitasatospora sp. NPDC057500 TaxID=3346151 RepID=UPI00368DF5D8